MSATDPGAGEREVPCSGGCGTAIRVVTLRDGSKGALMTCDGDGCPGNIQRYFPAEPDAGDDWWPEGQEGMTPAETLDPGAGERVQHDGHLLSCTINFDRTWTCDPTCPRRAEPDAGDVEALTEAEREQVALACDAMFDFGDTWIRFLRDGNETVLLPVVESILTARLAAVRREAEVKALTEELREFFDVFLAAEKIRAETRQAGDLAALLLRSDDEEAQKVGHDLLHHLSKITGWLRAHDAAGKRLRDRAARLGGA